MKNKSLILTIAILAFALMAGAAVLAQSGNAESSAQLKPSVSTSNQAVDSQVQTATETKTTTGSQIQTQAQKQIQDPDNNVDGAEVQVQNQNQIQNQGEETQVKNAEQQQQATERKSQVANAVQEMLRSATKIEASEEDLNIGLQIKTIAQIQSQNQEKIENSLEKVQSRNNLTKFLIGPNYSEIENAKKILEENRSRAQELNQIRSVLTDEGEQQHLALQAQVLEQVNLQVEETLNESQKGFSLFGWLVKFFR
jgi:lipopolysaccharide export LptBFGC system permease protein LptF